MDGSTAARDPPKKFKNQVKQRHMLPVAFDLVTEQHSLSKALSVTGRVCDCESHAQAPQTLPTKFPEGQKKLTADTTPKPNQPYQVPTGPVTPGSTRTGPALPTTDPDLPTFPNEIPPQDQTH